MKVVKRKAIEVRITVGTIDKRELELRRQIANSKKFMRNCTRVSLE